MPSDKCVATLASELHDLAMGILTDLEGTWYGDHEGDDLGHIAGYIGMLESQLDKARREAWQAKQDLDKAIANHAADLSTPSESGQMNAAPGEKVNAAQSSAPGVVPPVAAPSEAVATLEQKLAEANATLLREREFWRDVEERRRASALTDERLDELAATLKNPRRWQVRELLRQVLDEASAAPAAPVTSDERALLREALAGLVGLAEQAGMNTHGFVIHAKRFLIQQGVLPDSPSAESATPVRTEPPKEWTAWSGGNLPVPAETLVDVKFRYGEVIKRSPAGDWIWGHYEFHEDDDIIAYKVSAADRGNNDGG